MRDTRPVHLGKTDSGLMRQMTARNVFFSRNAQILRFAQDDDLTLAVILSEAKDLLSS